MINDICFGGKNYTFEEFVLSYKKMFYCYTHFVRRCIRVGICGFTKHTSLNNLGAYRIVGST